MRHLYFLAGRPEKARTLIQTLRTGGVASDNIHVMARDEQVMEALGGRPGTLEDFSDIESARYRGELGGAITGLAVTIAIILLAEEPQFNILWLVLGTLLGATLGFIASSIVGSSEDHPIFHEYERRLRKGDVMLAVDVDGADIDEVLALIHSVDPAIVVKMRKLTHVVEVEENHKQPSTP